MTNSYKFFVFIFCAFFCCSQSIMAQPFAPPVGSPGTSAVAKDSAAFVNWATGCHVHRGYQDISNPSLGYASVGDSTLVSGIADFAVLSLGDGGWATCTFQYPVTNGAGPDFAVFENGFDDTFLELAFVEASSDGLHFFRFPARSLSDTVTQTGSFGATDATKINNLAGKYRGGYGTPFDLQELAGTAGLDLNAITHIRIVDVVGSLNKLYATYDSQNARVNDPWPTAYASGGFDLDAIGVMHENKIVGIKENNWEHGIHVYPNPLAKNERLHINASSEIITTELIDYSGKITLAIDPAEIETSQLAEGIYLLKIITTKGIALKKISIQ